MRDIIKIFAAGSILTAYALLVPTLVEAVPAPAGAVIEHVGSHDAVIADIL